jgi:nucleotide-binding universal stress UspA family protein
MDAAQPIVFAYDGSGASRRAIERAASLLRPVPAIALTVWQSVGSVVFRHDLPESFEVARDVVDELDAATRRAAEGTAAEGSELLSAVGFQAEALARRAFEDSPRRTRTVWQEVVRVVEEREASAVVLGSRGRSSVGSAVLGSVSHGVVNHCPCTVLVVPIEEGRPPVG